MTDPVAAAVDEALDVVASLVRNFLNHGSIEERSAGGSPAAREPAAALESQQETLQ